MKKIATLGPPGTFCDMATGIYTANQSDIYQVEYFPTIVGTLAEIGNSCDIGIIPIENFSEGFIALVLDELIAADLHVVSEIILPIKFSMISNANALSDIQQLYVQFVARGQCFEFLDGLSNAKIVTTDSNIESLNRFKDSEIPSAAIVPSTSYRKSDFPLVVEEVNDYKNNQTRFLVMSKTVQPTPEEADKTSLIVLDDHDHPGYLGEVLLSFSKRNINLTSIISRPTRKTFGKYHFFIDFDGNIDDPIVAEALSEIGKTNNLKLLGSYKKAKSLS
ncbi:MULTISPECIES: prephenate dehydratase [Alteromonadaceae]|uniref:prephenate dehydratase n=1 Tax=Alteromonadaceae TaxID=72275 RepID=UPI001C0A60FB|nr:MULTISPECIES: prephenate dehydratase domain-containing protein [Aliiglaciecola]MBU2877103.1 ACT domain-containing protein [Aliiglaciecola lipolytica]MDO6710178.1 prephenate dehydratase domain-containing protein [Aliiglaciecola sp. 2_MG-2023]MDO6751326.1 prephenate dehydratase domain-containing protein [Aliiglaciecola sp. 1_MG-2023]